MQNEIRADVQLKGWCVPPSWVIGHSSRLIESWAPLVELLRLPGHEIADKTVPIRCFKGSTAELRIAHWTRKPWRRFRRRVSIQARDGMVFDSRYENGANVAHSVHSIVSRLIIGKRFGDERGLDPKVTVIVRSTVTPIEVRILELLGYPSIQTDNEVEGTILDVSGDSPRVFEEFQPALGATPTLVTGYPERLFVARRHTRHLLNQSECESILAEHGFVTAYFETLPLEEQWLMMANARHVVAIHGAGITGRIFGGWGDQTRSVTELFGGYFAGCYRDFAALQGHRWSAIRGRITRRVLDSVDRMQIARSMVNEPFTIDPIALRLRLEHLEDSDSDWPMHVLRRQVDVVNLYPRRDGPQNVTASPCGMRST